MLGKEITKFMSIRTKSNDMISSYVCIRAGNVYLPRANLSAVYSDERFAFGKSEILR